MFLRPRLMKFHEREIVVEKRKSGLIIRLSRSDSVGDYGFEPQTLCL